MHKSNKLQELVKQSAGDRVLRGKGPQQYYTTQNIEQAIKKQPGKPIVHTSSIKGPTKIIFDGHHFYYKYKRDEYTVFRCCYELKNKKCPAKVVTYKNLAYNLDGKHSHKLPATDKSVISVHSKTEGNIGVSEVLSYTSGVENSIENCSNVKIKEEKINDDEFIEITDEDTKKPTAVVVEDPDVFREKIKKRLQQRLSHEADLQDLLRESTQSSSTTTSRVAVKRGRPRKDTSGLPKAQKIIEKILETINNHSGQPILYASTTKGTMKLIYDGHHFRYSFRKGSYTIFQCCYKEVKEECPVRVVTDQKLVYPLDGEHIHFVQATDKSVTSVKFTPGEEAEPEFVNITAEEVEQELEESLRSEQDHVTLNVDDVMPRPITINVKEENSSTQINLEFTENIATEKSSQPLMDDKPKETIDDANEFREKIKKRLQRALLGKKKQ